MNDMYDLLAEVVRNGFVESRHYGTFDALRCPPSRPEDEPAWTALIRSGEGASRERMNCSGKHAAMLAACVVNGWPTEDYLDLGHPLQRRIAATMADAAGEELGPVAVDGCGAPLIADLVRRAGDRIVVMPGGGVTARNVARVVAATGVQEIHFAALSEQPSPAVHRNPYPFMGGELRRPEYERLVTTGGGISSVIGAAGG